jgi:hypothetical protein
MVSAAPWAAHFGLTRTPFGKSIPARELFARPAHAEAIARISFCIVDIGNPRYQNLLNARREACAA